MPFLEMTEVTKSLSSSANGTPTHFVNVQLCSHWKKKQHNVNISSSTMTLLYPPIGKIMPYINNGCLYGHICMISYPDTYLKFIFTFFKLQNLVMCRCISDKEHLRAFFTEPTKVQKAAFKQECNITITMSL